MPRLPKQATNAGIPSFSHRSALTTEDQETRCVGSQREGEEVVLGTFFWKHSKWNLAWMSPCGLVVEGGGTREAERS